MKKLVLALAVVAAAAFSPAAQDNGVVRSIREHKSGIGLWWLGNDSWLIKSGGILFAIDPDLESEEKVRPPVISAAELAGELDAVFVTHHHGDHCNVPTLRELARGRCSFVLPETCLKQTAKLALAKDRLVVAQPGQPFDIKGVHVEPIHAIHGNQEFTVLTREPDFVQSIAHSCGYIFNMGGKRLLQPGDSVLTEEHLGLKGIDVLFVSPTVHNMYIDRSMILINRLEPAYIFPQHFDTYRQTDENAFWTRGYPDELKIHLSQELQKRYHKLRQGEKFLIP
jgi:L-ascorbate 6-phosphate lactonase